MEKGEKIARSESEWRDLLSDEEFRVLRRAETERPFSGEYSKNEAEGIYHCAGCGNPLFSSEHKYDSGSGWPSFWQPVEPGRVETRSEKDPGDRRTEVICARCGGHLGHVFEDGPPPTGKRFCINSIALKFKQTGD